MSGHKVSNITVKALLLTISIFLLAACKSPLEKSILEPLTSKELDRVAGEDNSFLATYSIVEEKSNYIHTLQDSSRWKHLTYARLHSYLKTIESAELNSPLFAQLREKWEQMYSSYNTQVDTILRQWRQYLETNTPDSLLIISFEGIETEKIRNLNKQIDTLVKARIKYKSLSFPVDSFKMAYCFAPFNDSSATNNVVYKKRIKDSTTVKVFPVLIPELKKRLSSKDTALKFQYEIFAVYANGKCYNYDSLKQDLPKSVMQLINAEESSKESQFFDERYFREKIIRDLIDPAFISQSAYIKINAEDFYKEIDSLAHNYTNLH